MKEKRLLIFTEIFLFLVFINVLFFVTAYLEPLTPFKKLIVHLFPAIIVTSFFLFLSFKIVEFYHMSIYTQKSLMENLNNSLLILSSNLKVEKLLKNCIEILIDFYKGEVGILAVLDDDLKKFISTDIIAVNLSLLNEKFNEKEKVNYFYTVIFPDKIAENEKKIISNLIKEYQLEQYNGIVILPMFSEGKTRVVGIIGIKGESKKEIFNRVKMLKSIVEIFLTHVNLELENSLLQEKLNLASITDPVTEVYNRRFFNLRLKEEFARAKREEYPVSIMISDLDNFKKYVDSYGHPLGDIILKEFATILKTSLRETDIICRFGGDEFAYILPFTSTSDAIIVAERIRKNVQNYRFLKDIVNENVTLTLSIGIACFPEHGTKEEEILAKADNALYMAKNSGKNRICIFGEKGG